MAPLIIICVGAALSYVVSRQIYDAYGGELTTSALAGYFSFEFVLLAVVIIFGRVGDKTLGGPEAAIGRLFLLLLVWTPSIIVLAPTLSDYIARTSLGALFFPPVDKPVRNRLGRVKTLLWEENAPEAMTACLEEFEQYPDEPEILLDGATLFHDRGLYLEALKLLQKTMDAFYEDADVWAPAMYQAAVIRMERLDDGDTARAMFRRVAERFPDREIGMRSRERMHEHWYASLHDDTDPLHHKNRPCRTSEKAAIVTGMDADVPDPFYRKRIVTKAKDADAAEAPDPAEPTRRKSRLEEEMPGMFVDDEPT